MNELKTDPNVKIKASARPSEERALAGLAALVNNPDFAEGDANVGPFSAPGVIPSALDQKHARLVQPAPAPASRPVPLAVEDEGLAAAAEVITVPAPTRAMPANIYTTGRLRVGKDYILRALGYRIHGFADPIYALAEMFFGTSDKTKPGVREFMQSVGQWGRGEVNEAYRLTPVRGMFTVMIRSLAAAKQLPDLGVDWPAFGSPNLWVNALINRIEQSESGDGMRNAVSNVRFENEYNKLKDAGWTHFHVMCSQSTWEKRLRDGGMDPKSPALKDTSEHMAIGMDRDTMEHIRVKPRGPKLRVIWNDDMVKSPSPRLYTLAELGS